MAINLGVQGIDYGSEKSLLGVQGLQWGTESSRKDQKFVITVDRDNFQGTGEEIRGTINNEIARTTLWSDRQKALVGERRNINTPNSDHNVSRWQDRPCALSVVRRDGEAVPLLNSMGQVPLSSYPEADGTLDQTDSSMQMAYTDFIVTSASISSSEKNQIVETFGDVYMFFFGSQVQALQVSGILLDSPNYPWLTEWQYNYNHFLKGTKLIENNARAYFRLGFDVYEGYLANCNISFDATDDYRVPFVFTFFVTNQIRATEDLWQSWWTTFVRENLNMSTATPEKKKPGLMQTISKDLAKIAFNTITNPGKLKRLASSEEAYTAFVTGAAITVFGDVFDYLVENKIFGTTGNAAIADVSSLATSIAGNPSNWTAVVGGFASDVYNGLSTGVSGFDSGGSAFVTELQGSKAQMHANGVENQPTPPLGSEWAPPKLSR
jgi:hypothetical protein